uniref:Localized to the inner membrane of the chloroplast n=1 Tax=Solanum tuberosum TaxID=4113 RepID=M1AM95_SOLTU
MPGSCLKSLDQNVSATKLSFSPSHGGKSYSSKRPLTIQASYRSSGSGAGIFVGGFVLGGIIVGTLGCVFAPQISKALAGADKKDLMRKLPKFIYDEDKALEKQRKKLAEKIDQLNSAIDDISTQLRSDDTPNGAAVNSDDVEAVV